MERRNLRSSPLPPNPSLNLVVGALLAAPAHRVLQILRSLLFLGGAILASWNEGSRVCAVILSAVAFLSEWRERPASRLFFVILLVLSEFAKEAKRFLRSGRMCLLPSQGQGLPFPRDAPHGVRRCRNWREACPSRRVWGLYAAHCGLRMPSKGAVPFWECRERRAAYSSKLQK